MTAVTFTANVQAAIAYGLPAEIAASGEASWQASRDWYFGVAPEIDIYTFEFPLSEVKIPLYAMWFTYGYENVDMSYNMAGVSQAELSVTPDFFGSADSVDSNNVQYPRFTATTVEFQFLHGFPLTMHSSFVLTSDDYYTHLSADNFLDPRGLLKGLSSEYMNLSAGGAFVFPLWRQINGGPAYADALYGQIGYGLSFYTNKPNSYTGHMYVSNVLTAGFKLGFYKSYEFARLLSAAVSWDILRNNVGASFSVGF
jgi:hypothetical protein